MDPNVGAFEFDTEPKPLDDGPAAEPNVGALAAIDPKADPLPPPNVAPPPKVDPVPAPKLAPDPNAGGEPKLAEAPKPEAAFCGVVVFCNPNPCDATFPVEPEPKADCPPEPNADEFDPPKAEVDVPNAEPLELPNRPLEVVVVAVPPAPNVEDVPNGFLLALSGLALPPSPPRKLPPVLPPPNKDPEVEGGGLLEPPNTLVPAEEVPEPNGDAVEA